MSSGQAGPTRAAALLNKAASGKGALALDRAVTPREAAALGLIAANDNQKLTVLDVVRDSAPTRVYNFEVESLPGEITHNYLVGDDAAWVHNGLGAYVVTCADGSIYVGKGDAARASRQLRSKCGTAGGTVRTFKSDSVCGSYRLEDRLMKFLGWGDPRRRGTLLNKIGSPGANIRPGGSCGCR